MVNQQFQFAKSGSNHQKTSYFLKSLTMLNTAMLRAKGNYKRLSGRAGLGMT